jgi:hypothetical protein
MKGKCQRKEVQGRSVSEVFNVAKETSDFFPNVLVAEERRGVDKIVP